MTSTTPNVLDEHVQEFCRSISDSRCVLVPVLPAQSAEMSQCFYNVRDRVELSGGTIAFGWTIWEWPRVYIEAEHHAVWEDPDGNLIDVTPKNDEEDSIAFLPDPSAKFFFKKPKWKDNIRKAIVDDLVVHEFLRAKSEYMRFVIRHSYPVGREKRMDIVGGLVTRFEFLKENERRATREMAKYQ